MNQPLSILANAPIKNPGVSDALPYLLGFVVVLVTLSILMGLCMLIGSILKNFEPAPEAPQRVVKRARQDARDEVIPTEVVAVIAAAVATVTGNRKIISIKPRQSSWGHSGRQRVQSSHSIRKS